PAEDLKRLVTEKLKEAGLTFERADAYVTPRRLALVIDGLPLQQPDVTEEKKGPRVGAPEAAIHGFLRGAGLSSLDQCEQRDTGKGTFWFAVIRRQGVETGFVLLHVLEDALMQIPWPKSMRWRSDTDWVWVRPLRNVMCLLWGDGKRLRIEVRPGIYSDRTFGHRFLAPGPIEPVSFADYKAKLKVAKVILDPAERRAIIRDRAEKLAAAAGLTVKPDEALLDEVVGLVEWPVVLMGRIDEAFMDLPPEVLTTTMSTNQKYFSLLDKGGRLAPPFLVVANIETNDGGTAIVAGNERVLRARLADARFFWDQDRKTRLEERVPALKDIVFHARLGSLADKVQRMQALAAEIAAFVPGADVDRVRSAALLAKADLTTGMVGEFPELQGIMGRYYALNEGEKPAVADAIAEHYAPLGPNDRCPTAPVSVAVALADKIDTLVGFFAIAETPTGSKDPYALRRAALGAIRLIVENRLRLPLREIFGRADRLHAEQGAGFAGRLDPQGLLDFFADRMKVALREKGVRHDLVSAVFALGDEDDLVRLLARVAALTSFLESEDGANLLTAYKRASNIVRIEEKKDGAAYNGSADPGLLRAAEETALHVALAAAGATSGRALREEDFTGAMAAVARLRAPVDDFFDRVTVNCDDAGLRANRLRLLSEIRSTLSRVADFSKVEG
ncbi:MAG: glycine--tRNA ligase subunit beta, partial [Dongiaceae bacterium]